jgi:hypothetical protein
VVALRPGSPAEAAGVQIGDRLLQVAARDVRSTRHVHAPRSASAISHQMAHVPIESRASASIRSRRPIGWVC